MKTLNHLIVIGYMGIKRCYLNISLEEARDRYFQSEGDVPSFELIDEFDFEDEFCAYDAYYGDPLNKVKGD